MKVYSCGSCNKKFKQKSHYDKHILNKKRPCASKSILKKYSKKYSKKHSDTQTKGMLKEPIDQIPVVPLTADMISNIEIVCPSSAQGINPESNLKKIDIYDLINVDTHDLADKNTCIYCNKFFSRNDNLQRHLTTRCKSKKKYDELEMLKGKFLSLRSEIDKLKKENDELKHSHVDNNHPPTGTTNTIINNGTVGSNNNVNIVQLVQFGNENIDDIDIKEIFNTYLSSTGGNIVSNILKLTNFNKKYPENHNICITDLSRELVKIYNGTKFITKKFKNVKADILNKIVKNTRKLVKKLENDKTIKKTQDAQSKIKINNVSLKLIDGQSPEDIVREEIKEKNKLLKNNLEMKSKKNNVDKIHNENTDVEDNDSEDSELEDSELEDIEFNFDERQRIKYLEEKQLGLINIAHERIKDELYNNRESIF
jgi:hypothetical protein